MTKLEAMPQLVPKPEADRSTHEQPLSIEELVRKGLSARIDAARLEAAPILKTEDRAAHVREAALEAAASYNEWFKTELPPEHFL
jgi:hypothetical protein